MLHASLRGYIINIKNIQTETSAKDTIILGSTFSQSWANVSENVLFSMQTVICRHPSLDVTAL